MRRFLGVSLTIALGLTAVAAVPAAASATVIKGYECGLNAPGGPYVTTHSQVVISSSGRMSFHCRFDNPNPPPKPVKGTGVCSTFGIVSPCKFKLTPGGRVIFSGRLNPSVAP